MFNVFYLIVSWLDGHRERKREKGEGKKQENSFLLPFGLSVIQLKTEIVSDR